MARLKMYVKSLTWVFLQYYTAVDPIYILRPLGNSITRLIPMNSCCPPIQYSHLFGSLNVLINFPPDQVDAHKVETG